MKIPINKPLFLITLICFNLIGCGGSESGSDDNPETELPSESTSPPSAATLLFPENNSECNTGEVVSDLKSNVTFEWNNAENADSYALTATNLNSGTSTTVISSTNQATILIDRGTPYEWSVTSRSSDNTAEATSASWRFYNEGIGNTNYAPFPASAVAPTTGANLPMDTSSITLEWITSDIDNDELTHEVLLDTTNPPIETLGQSDTFLMENIDVTSGTIYYWQVISWDVFGNTASSDIFEFKVL